MLSRGERKHSAFTTYGGWDRRLVARSLQQLSGASERAAFACAGRRSVLRDVLIHSGQSTLIKLISNLTLSLTNNLIVDLVRFGVTLTIRLAIKLSGRSADYPSQFPLAPAASGSPPSTPPRPLIPPSQPRGRDQRSGLQKHRQKTGQGQRKFHSQQRGVPANAETNVRGDCLLPRQNRSGLASNRPSGMVVDAKDS